MHPIRVGELENAWMVRLGRKLHDEPVLDPALELVWLGLESEVVHALSRARVCLRD